MHLFELGNVHNFPTPRSSREVIDVSGPREVHNFPTHARRGRRAGRWASIRWRLGERQGTVITFRNLSVSIGDVALLHPFNARVERGSVAAVRGANGTGKTTLLRVLLGRQEPSTGSVAIEGVDIDERDPGFRRTVAGMLHHPPEARDMTILEHATLVAATWTSDVDEARTLAAGTLEELSLTGLSERFPHELSTGQRQLAALSLVLVRPAELLVLDEPEQRLDANRVDLLAAALLRRRDDGATIVFATHSDELTESAADGVLNVEPAA